MTKLDYNFFNRHVVNVAQDLLGQQLVFGPHAGIITETEAYRGFDDPASHAFRGKTPRASIMFGPPGRTYVYFIYGMYHCLNIVTEQEGSPSAVLIRGIQLTTPPFTHLNGPGKICRDLKITKEHNGIDITKNNNFYVKSCSSIQDYQSTPRIGIRVGTDKLWRFVIKPPLISFVR